MLKSHLCAEVDYLGDKDSLRTKQLNIFYSIKEKNHFISRQVLYLGIAILDKFSQKAPLVGLTTENTARTMLIKAATALWIAWKFLEN